MLYCPGNILKLKAEKEIAGASLHNVTSWRCLTLAAKFYFINDIDNEANFINDIDYEDKKLQRNKNEYNADFGGKKRSLREACEGEAEATTSDVLNVASCTVKMAATANIVPKDAVSTAAAEAAVE